MIRKAAICIASLYLFYVLGTAVLLNTPLLRHLAGMANTTLTHIKFTAAWSLYPGHLRAKRLVVAIRDQHVKVDVDVGGIKGRFRILPLLKKRIHVDFVEASKGALIIDLKKADGTAEHHATHSKPSDMYLPSDKRREQMKAVTWNIQVDRVTATLNRVHVDNRDFEGTAKITGGFSLTPGVEAEIFPAHLRINQGNIKDKLSNLNLDAKVRFHKFSIPETGGNEVFNYVDADVNIDTITKDLEILNTTLRSLPGYRFSEGSGNLRCQLNVRRGHILSTSFLRLTPSSIVFNAPTFRLKGLGNAHWYVPAHGRFSVMDVTIIKPSAVITLGADAQALGTMKKVSAHNILYGLDMVSVFNGLAGTVTVTEGRMTAKNKPRKEGPRWTMKLSMNGKIGAIAGKAPRPVNGEGPTSRMEVVIVESSVHIQKPKLDLAPLGTLVLETPPVDFGRGLVRFKSLNANFYIEPEEGKRVDVALVTTDASRDFSTKDGGTDRWRGHSEVTIQGFDHLLDTFAEPLNIPGLVKTFASTSQLVADVEWELAGDSTWLRTRSLETSGIWSLWGTYLARRGQPATGVFEVSVLGIPVGLSLKNDDTAIRVFPSAQWYDSSLE